MTRHLMRLAAMAIAVVLTAAAPAPAQAATEALAFNMTCGAMHLDTPWGPLGLCTQKNGNTGRPGYHSGITGEFNAITGWVSLVGWMHYQDLRVRATDGYVGQTQGYGALSTAYGPTVWATQYRDSPTGGRWEGRFGTWNLITDTFYPSSGWWPHSLCHPPSCPS